MFRKPTLQNTARSLPQLGDLVPAKIPYKGINANAPYTAMTPDFGISLINVLAENYGMRTRGGYKEWATNIPGGSIKVATMMHYHSSASGVPTSNSPSAVPIGKVFAAKGNNLYDITVGGAGAWVAEAVVTGVGPYWSWVNFQNSAGNFLLACNESGGYAIYDGAVWTMPTMGGGAGQIANVNPANLVFVTVWKRRVWFIEKNSSKAWYLPVDQITGAATAFDLGPEMPHGGPLACIASWTASDPGGGGLAARIVFAGYNGDIVIYSGSDPAAAATFAIQGTWFSGALPYGRRQLTQAGGDVFVLSQLGVIPLSNLMALTGEELDTSAVSELVYGSSATGYIAPIVSKIMKLVANSEGWQIDYMMRDELLLISIPANVLYPTVEYISYRQSNPSWSMLGSLGFASFANVGGRAFAGTLDGRVVLAFEDVLDNIKLDGSGGAPILCQVTPAYQPLGDPGLSKRVLMVRPTFLSAGIPSVSFTILTDFQTVGYPASPAIPNLIQGIWNNGRWDSALWGGVRLPIREWFGSSGEGYVATVQFDYLTAAGTILSNIDFWVEQGGPL